MLDLPIQALVIIALSAMLSGFSKTGVPGTGILMVPLMASVLPAKQSVGLLLGILILSDIFAITYYRRHAQWNIILKMLPATVLGIVTGFVLLRIVTNQQLAPIIGTIVLVMLAINAWRQYVGQKDKPVPDNLAFAIFFGFLAGVTTMMANAAGPVMVIYLLAMGLDKVNFIGTRAWFFFIVNWLKVPFSTSLELMTPESIKLNLIMIPFIAVGALIGIFTLKKIPQRAFAVAVQLLAAASALKLLV